MTIYFDKFLNKNKTKPTPMNSVIKKQSKHKIGGKNIQCRHIIKISSCPHTEYLN